jgi:DNA-binding transcriptional regulator PaaX
VLLCIAKEPEIRIRDIAPSVGITERMVQKLVTELVAAGYLGIEKQGRRNRYNLNRKLRLRHPLEAHHTIGEVLDLLATP